MVAVPGLVVLWSGTAPRRDILRIAAGERLVLGRDQVDPTDDDRISRRHVEIEIERDGRRMRARDLGSRNGTYLNGLQLPDGLLIPLPAVIRTGRTVSIVVPDVGRYEEVLAPGGESMIERAMREVERAALAEENVTLECAPWTGMELARRYAGVIGGATLLFDPSVHTDGLDAFLTDTRPKTVILMLTSSALPLGDMPTVQLWLETDVRFVTVMMYDAMPLSLMPVELVGLLRSRVVTVYPRFDEIPTLVRDAVLEHAPQARLHSSAVERMLVEARVHEHDTLMNRFRVSFDQWRTRGLNMLRDEDLIDEFHPIDPAQCFAGVRAPRRG